MSGPRRLLAQPDQARCGLLIERPGFRSLRSCGITTPASHWMPDSGAPIAMVSRLMRVFLRVGNLPLAGAFYRMSLACSPEEGLAPLTNSQITPKRKAAICFFAPLSSRSSPWFGFWIALVTAKAALSMTAFVGVGRVPRMAD